jgi:hypothetical protein
LNKAKVGSAYQSYKREVENIPDEEVTPEMKEDKYNRIADEEGLSARDKIVFRMFMQKRFPEESYYVDSYSREWAVRIRDRTAWSHADSESRRKLTESGYI